MLNEAVVAVVGPGVAWHVAGRVGSLEELGSKVREWVVMGLVVKVARVRLTMVCKS